MAANSEKLTPTYCSFITRISVHITEFHSIQVLIHNVARPFLEFSGRVPTCETSYSHGATTGSWDKIPNGLYTHLHHKYKEQLHCFRIRWKGLYHQHLHSIRENRLQVIKWLTGIRTRLTCMETTLLNVLARNFISLIIVEELVDSSMLRNATIMDTGTSVWLNLHVGIINQKPRPAKLPYLH